MKNTTTGHIALERAIRDLVEHEIFERGKSDDIAIATLCLDYIDWVEILFALEDRYDIELDDSILDLITAGPRAIADAIIERVAQRNSRSDKSP